MTIKINELMEALAEANTAANTLPKVQAELRSLIAELDRAKAQIERLHRGIEATGLELKSAKAEAVSAKEERDEATFHAMELEEKLESITSVMGKTLGLVVPPKDEPKVEPIEPEAAVGVSQGAVANEGIYSQTKDGDWSSERDESYASLTYYDTEGEEAYRQTPEVPEVASIEPHPSEAPDGSNQTPPATSSSAAPSTLLTDDIQPIYMGRAWGSKPSTVTWKDFVAAGGERPYWMNEDAARFANYV